MFDTKAEIGLKLQSPEGPKKIVVTFPKDEQFIEWRRKKKISQKDLGRRSFQIEPSKPEACDLTLVNAIRVDKETDRPIDEAEAFYVLAQLSDAEVSERPEREGSSFKIRMKILRRLMVSHTLRIPSVREMMDYERNRSSVIFGAYGNQEIRINFAAAGDLYDKLKVSTEGYADGVPIPHKAEAINVLLQELRAEQEEAPESGDDLD